MKTEWKRWVLRYAVELVVIFTGITLSFAFDEWRKERDERQNEKKLLQSICRELLSKEKELQKDRMDFLIAVTQLDSALHGATDANTNKGIINMLNYSTSFFDPTTVSWALLNEQNMASIIQNDSVRETIFSAYQVNLRSAQVNYEMLFRTKEAEILPLTRKLLAQKNEKPQQWAQRAQAALNAMSGQQMLNTARQEYLWLANQNQGIATRIGQKRRLIEAHLAQKK